MLGHLPVRAPFRERGRKEGKRGRDRGERNNGSEGGRKRKKEILGVLSRRRDE